MTLRLRPILPSGHDDPNARINVPAVGDWRLHRDESGKKTNDDLHSVQYHYECIENPLYSSGWQYKRKYTPAADLPLGTSLSFQHQNTRHIKQAE